MGVKLSSFKTDPTKAVEGVWVDYANGLRFKLARFNNPHYAEYVRKETRKHSVQLRRGELGLDAVEQIQMRGVAKHVVLDWEGMLDDDEQPIAYSEERCFELISDPAYREFYDTLVELATSVSLFQADAQEADAGN